MIKLTKEFERQNNEKELNELISIKSTKRTETHAINTLAMQCNALPTSAITDSANLLSFRIDKDVCSPRVMKVLSLAYKKCASAFFVQRFCPGGIPIFYQL